MNDRSGDTLCLESPVARARLIEDDFDQKLSVYKDLRDKKRW